MEENIDGISKIWLPDKKLCERGEELRAESEWLRKGTGMYGARPSQLGIESYRYGNILHKSFFEGRFPPPVPLDSVENLEWYEDQLKRCIYGYERGNVRVTGDHYWMLNFTPFSVALKDANGRITSDFDITFPYYATMHDYVFKLIEEAHYEKKNFMWMSGRGSGKTYVTLSIGAKIYHLKPRSHSMISASNSGHAVEAFDKMRTMLNSIAEVHPTLALNRLIDTQSLIKSGQSVIRDGVSFDEGPQSRMQKVIYGDNPGVTRGSRPDYHLFEEVGDWAGGKGNLKACLGATFGSWRVGSIRKVRAFLIGTGGSVTSDQAKDVFTHPEAYNILPVSDFKPKIAFFLPTDYLFGGCGWEETTVNDNERARNLMEAERKLAKEDMEIFTKLVQEFPFTVDEVFSRLGSNTFNQKKISQQWTALHYEKKDLLPKRGFLEWVKDGSNKIIDVKFALNPEGDVEVVEEPYRGEKGDQRFKDLYIAGIDSIDQGVLDSTSIKDRSSLACLIKKRTVDGQYFKQSSNLYVAKYVGRSLDVRWDYENALKLAMWYGAKVNLEYTRIGIVSYFKEMRQYHRFMKRPLIAMPSGGDGIARAAGLDHSQLIGTSATTHVIDHQDGKIKEYVDDYSDQIFFIDMLEELRDYRRTDRRKFDLVIAMGLCEIADEDLLGIAAKADSSETEELEMFGYYVDPTTGYKKFGVIKSNKINEAIAHEREEAPANWIDVGGAPRFDSNFGDEVVGGYG